MAEHEDGVGARRPAGPETAADERRPDALPLAPGHDGHRHEAEHRPRRALRGDGAERDVADDRAVVEGDQAGVVWALVAELGDQLGLVAAAERERVDAADVAALAGLLGPDDDARRRT